MTAKLERPGHYIVLGRAGDRFTVVCTCGWVGGEFHESRVAQQVYEAHFDLARTRGEARR